MHTSDQSPATTFVASRKTSLTKAGGALGIAACFIALAIFLLALLGFNAAFIFSPLPVAFALLGMVLTVCGGVVKTAPGQEETQPVAALFVCLAGLVAGAMELLFWSWMWS
jgi:hypothetical protein